MNYTYYKFSLIDNVFEEEIHKSMVEQQYQKIYEEEIENIKMEVHQKTKKDDHSRPFPIFILYVKAKSIDEEMLDLIMNYYLMKAGVDSYPSDKYLWVYAIFHIEDYSTIPCLHDFIKYGMFYSSVTRHKRYKRTQIPIVFDESSNSLYIGKRITTPLNELYSTIYKNLEEYYKKHSLDINQYVTGETKTGKGFKQDVYPIKITYTKFSKKYNVLKLAIMGISIDLILLYIIYVGIKTSSPYDKDEFAALVIMFVLITGTTIEQILKIQLKAFYKKYQKIKIEEPSYEIFINNMKTVLINKGYQEKNSGVFFYKNKKIYFLNQTNYSKVMILPTSYLMIDSYETYQKLSLSETELKQRNIVALIYQNSFLHVLNRDSEKRMKYICKIINKVYKISNKH